MDKKIIIGIILTIVVVGACAAIGFNMMMTYEKKTVEIFENGTTMTVPATLEETNRTEDTVNFADENNTTKIIGFRFDNEDNFLNLNAWGSAIVDSFIHNITDKAELQENGIFKLSAEERKKIAAQSGNYIKDKGDAKDIYIGVLKNESLNQTILIISENEQYVVDMMDSVEWKKAASTNIKNETVAVATPVSRDNNTTDLNESDDKKNCETDDGTTSGVSAEYNQEDFSNPEDYNSNYEDAYSNEEVSYGGEEYNLENM